MWKLVVAYIYIQWDCAKGHDAFLNVNVKEIETDVIPQGKVIHVLWLQIKSIRLKISSLKVSLSNLTVS